MNDDIIRSAIKNFKTPFYLYDKEKIERNIKILKSSLMEDSKLYYSMKANPLLGICEIVNRNGCGIEVASKGELFVALKAGVEPKRIIFTGPGKTEEDIKFAIEKKIKLINIESLEEAELINRLAKKNNSKIQIALRLNPSNTFSNSKIKMSGVSSQFGIDLECLDYKFFKRLKELSNIDLIGIQVYFGTQNLNADEIVKNTEYIIKIAIELSRKYFFELKYLNLGGGFGVKYFENENELDMERLKIEMNSIKTRYKKHLVETELIFESGRFIMADAGYFIVKVVSCKSSKNNKYAICDGGANFHAASAFLGRFIRRNFPMYVLSKENIKKEVYTITGSLCTPTDVIGQNVIIFKELKVGDHIIIKKSGAYGLTHSPVSFLSHCLPNEIIYDDNKFKILRERGNVEDFLYNQKSFY